MSQSEYKDGIDADHYVYGVYDHTIICPYLDRCSSSPGKCSSCGHGKQDYWIPQTVPLPDIPFLYPWGDAGRENLPFYFPPLDNGASPVV